MIPLSHAVPRVRDDAESLLDGGRGCELRGISEEYLRPIGGRAGAKDLPIREIVGFPIAAHVLVMDPELFGHLPIAFQPVKRPNPVKNGIGRNLCGFFKTACIMQGHSLPLCKENADD